MIYITSKRKSTKSIDREYPDAVVVDVTSSSPSEYVKPSPFYPYGGIPVPNSEPLTASCVEAIWQGLKVLFISALPMPYLSIFWPHIYLGKKVIQTSN